MGHISVFGFPAIDGLGGWAMALAVRRRFYWDVVLVLLLALVLVPLVFYDGFPISHLLDSTVLCACSLL
ncbi:hypothetical protein GUJ93_ZPchr0007g6042 [Zizania palustris]|uniref:Uncharacterized protein n=1 Tax=Zizania palustris TaxID=103762 RepID=A0A8J5VSK5_ZIZPA|nr:hypothetical protein GUJ93_ZPchr0007g6042 [Zizania palustris]